MLPAMSLRFYFSLLTQQTTVGAPVLVRQPQPKKPGTKISVALRAKTVAPPFVAPLREMTVAPQSRSFQ